MSIEPEDTRPIPRDQRDGRRPAPDFARSFGGVVDAYDRGRPGYPREAAAWLTGARPLQVLELGAGTGKLTEQLVALGHAVHATEPDPQMLAVLQRNLPGVRTSQSTAEEIPAGDASYDVVVCAQAFHWFDLERALPEIARVLRPHGGLSLVWNQRDERIPWVRRLGAIIGTQDQLREPAEALASSALFHEPEEETFPFWQLIDRRSVVDLVRSRSNVAVLPPAQQEAKVAEVRAFYDDFGRGMDGMQLPYSARCFRAVVRDRVTPTLADREPGGAGADADRPAVSDGSSTDMLLIDFR